MATLNISLSDELKQFVDAQVAEHGYGSSSEYLHDLLRRQRDVERLRASLQAGLESGPATAAGDAFFADLRRIAQCSSAA